MAIRGIFAFFSNIRNHSLTSGSPPSVACQKDVVFHTLINLGEGMTSMKDNMCALQNCIKKLHEKTFELAVRDINEIEI